MSHNAVTAIIQAEGLPLTETELARYVEKYPLQRAAADRLYSIPGVSAPPALFSTTLQDRE